MSLSLPTQAKPVLADKETIQEEQPCEQHAVQEEQAPSICPHFKTTVMDHPVLRIYATRLKGAGFDTIDALKFITPKDMSQMGMLVGHRRLLVASVAACTTSTSSTTK